MVLWARVQSLRKLPTFNFWCRSKLVPIGTRNTKGICFCVLNFCASLPAVPSILARVSRVSRVSRAQGTPTLNCVGIRNRKKVKYLILFFVFLINLDRLGWVD